MAGLSVVLETTTHNHKNHPAGGKPAAQIISKATLLAMHGPNKRRQVSASPFLQRCCLCHTELAEGRDIYMYRGDRAFCSEECRRRQIFMDEHASGSNSSDSNCANGAAAATARGSRRVAGGGRVAY